jgi:hypothetical protein
MKKSTLKLITEASDVYKNFNKLNNIDVSSLNKLIKIMEQSENKDLLINQIKIKLNEYLDNNPIKIYNKYKNNKLVKELNNIDRIVLKIKDYNEHLAIYFTDYEYIVVGSDYFNLVGQFSYGLDLESIKTLIFIIKRLVNVSDFSNAEKDEIIRNITTEIKTYLINETES